MTADRLDEQTEARIREACVKFRWSRYDPDGHMGDEWHNPDPYDFEAPNACCICLMLRALLKADREARETKLNAAVEAAAIGEWMEAALDGEPVSDFAEGFGPVRKAIDMHARAAHADALAEASRGFLVSALRFYSASPTPSYDERFEGALGALREVLAAHDKRRRG